MAKARFTLDGDIGEVVFADPPLNLFGLELARDLAGAVGEAGGSGARAVLVRAEGDNFSAGANVEIFLDRDEQAARELIEESRRGHLERMRIMTVPGRYRTPSFSFHQQVGKAGTSPISHDIMLNVPVEIDIRPDGHMTIDFEGATPQSWTPFNCPLAASDGILFVALTQFMDYDGRVNDGGTTGHRRPTRAVRSVRRQPRLRSRR